MKKTFAVLLCLILLISSVSAISLKEIGSNIVSGIKKVAKAIVNFVTAPVKYIFSSPSPSTSNGESSATSSTGSDPSPSGSSTIPKDSGNSGSTSSTTSSSSGTTYKSYSITSVLENFQVQTGEALFYDVDISDIKLFCPSCRFIDNSIVETAGFPYVVEIDLIQKGTVESSGVELEVMVETPTNTYKYTQIENPLSLSTGNHRIIYITPDIGRDLFGKIQNEYIGSSVNEVFEIKVTAKINKDNAYKFPVTSQLTKRNQKCSYSGSQVSCTTWLEYYLQQQCPQKTFLGNIENKICEKLLGTTKTGDDVQTIADVGNCLDVTKCIVPDSKEENELTKTFQKSKITPELQGSGNIII